MVIVMKTCVKCNSEKDNSLFHKDNLRPDGLFPYCKECRRTSSKPFVVRTVDIVLSSYVVSSSGCWEWTGTIMQKEDYGIACHRGKRQRAHRLSYMYHKGQIPEGLLICHTCDNPPCINPDHLYAGTPKDNSSDMVSKGRQNRPKGEDSARAKLTAVQVVEIRSDTRKHKPIAKDYGIAVSTVSSIKQRTNWSHI